MKNGGHRFTAAELASKQAEIESVSAAIRAAKESKLRETNPREWWLLVRKLLLLKYDVALFTGDATGLSMTRPGDLFLETKLRWCVKAADGTVKRLQRLVQCRTTFTAQEILTIVTEFTASRFPQLGGPLTIATRSDLLDVALRFPANAPDAKTVTPDPLAKRTLCLDDVLTLPLEFPGPCLPNSCTIDLDVTFAVPRNSVCTPACYVSEEQKTVLPELVDAGVNLSDKDLKGQVLGVLHEANVAGVSQAISLGMDVESSRFNVLVARSARGSAFATVGVHPCAVPKEGSPDEAVKELANLIEEDGKREDGKRLIVAVGEIGLDYVKETGVPPETQMAWFDAQLQLALKYSMPVVVHLRGPEALDKGIEMLRARSAAWRGAVDCFNGSLEQMKALIDLGFYITLTGLICKDTCADLVSVVASGARERYLIGSDAPYLIPANMEKPWPKCNRPSTLPHVAAMLASILKMPVQQVAELTTANARAAFSLPAVAYNSALPAAGVAFNANAFVERPLIDGTKSGGVRVKAKARKPQQQQLVLLSAEAIAALMQPGQKPFVNEGYVYACPPGICTALESMASTNNPGLKQSITEFISAGVITQVHDPHPTKKKGKKNKKKGNSNNNNGGRRGGRRVRRRVVHRRSRRHHH